MESTNKRNCNALNFEESPYPNKKLKTSAHKNDNQSTRNLKVNQEHISGYVIQNLQPLQTNMKKPQQPLQTNLQLDPQTATTIDTNELKNMVGQSKDITYTATPTPRIYTTYRLKNDLVDCICTSCFMYKCRCL